MKKMLVHEGDRYQVICLNNNGGLITNPEEEKSIEGCREAIDYANSRAVASGYKPERWMIVHQVWNNVYDLDGNFCESHETVTRVEIYPHEI